MSKCPVSREQFMASNVSPSSVMGRVADNIALERKVFSSGGFGFWGGGKITIPCGHESVRCQVSVSVSVIGSKDASFTKEELAAKHKEIEEMLPNLPPSDFSVDVKELAAKAEALANS